MSDRFDCPEAFCIQAFRPVEMKAHLQMDHGKSEYRAEKIVERHSPENGGDSEDIEQ